MELTDNAYHKLLYSIFELLLKRGIKGLTMDIVASSLGMSKRTLYEIFENKTDMIVKTMTHMSGIRREISIEVFNSAPNSLLAIIRIFLIQRQFMCNVNVNFFRDMDNLFPEVKEHYRAEAQMDFDMSRQLFEKGIEEGLLRPDVDYDIQLRMLGVQMESLKRMEEHFPPEISLIKAYDAIYTGFLRGIVSMEGMKVLDALSSDVSEEKKKIEKYLYKNEIED